jgi:hypothetical protein
MGVCVLIGVTLVLFSLPSAAQSQGESYQYIDIKNPFLRKIPLAVPHFKNGAGSAREEDTSRKAADLLAGSLDFTGYFKILDRAAFLFDPRTSGVAATDINFQNWTIVGAELLITGAFEQTGDTVQMELRLFDTIRSRQILGKRYSGNTSEMRKMVHRFCAEVVFLSHGQSGHLQQQDRLCLHGLRQEGDLCLRIRRLWSEPHDLQRFDFSFSGVVGRRAAFGLHLLQVRQARYLHPQPGRQT